MTRTKVVCPECDGMGEYDTPHPMWGLPSCPEAYVTRKCEACEGTGMVDPGNDDQDGED